MTALNDKNTNPSLYKARICRTCYRNRYYNKATEIRVCPECKESFKVGTAIRSRRRKYCSEECRLKAQIRLLDEYFWNRWRKGVVSVGKLFVP